MQLSTVEPTHTAAETKDTGRVRTTSTEPTIGRALQEVKRWFDTSLSTLDASEHTALEAREQTEGVMAQAQSKLREAEARLREAETAKREAETAAREATARALEARQACEHVDAQRRVLGSERLARLRQHVESGLRQSQKALHARAREVQAAQAAHRTKLQEIWASNPEIATLEAELKEFRNVDLKALPASYREAMQAHQSTQQERLNTLKQSLDPGLAALDTPLITLESVWAVHTSATGTQLSCVLPVYPQVLEASKPADHDPALQFAARVVEAMVRFAADLGAAPSEVLTQPVGSLLMVSVTLAKHQDSVEHGFTSLLQTVFSGAHELGDARIQCVFPHVDHGIWTADEASDDDFERQFTEEIELEVEND